MSFYVPPENSAKPNESRPASILSDYEPSELSAKQKQIQMNESNQRRPASTSSDYEPSESSAKQKQIQMNECNQRHSAPFLSDYVPTECSQSEYSPSEAPNYQPAIPPIPEEKEEEAYRRSDALGLQATHNYARQRRALSSLSDYAESEVPSQPQFQPQPQFQSQHHVQPAQIHPDDLIKAQYRQRPPISAKTRQPDKLYNTDCGVPYLGAGAVGKRDDIRFNALWNSEAARIIRIIILIYFYRNNTIAGKYELPLAAIKQIHCTELIDYKISISELYKRYLVHLGYLSQRQADNYNFWKLESAERRRWTRHLEKVGKSRDVVGMLWRLGEERGKEFLQLIHSPMTLSFVQTVNAVHDIMALWNSIFESDTYIDNDLAKMTKFNHC